MSIKTIKKVCRYMANNQLSKLQSLDRGMLLKDIPREDSLSIARNWITEFCTKYDWSGIVREITMIDEVYNVNVIDLTILTRAAGTANPEVCQWFVETFDLKQSTNLPILLAVRTGNVKFIEWFYTAFMQNIPKDSFSRGAIAYISKEDYESNEDMINVLTKVKLLQSESIFALNTAGENENWRLVEHILEHCEFHSDDDDIVRLYSAYLPLGPKRA